MQRNKEPSERVWLLFPKALSGFGEINSDNMSVPHGLEFGEPYDLVDFMLGVLMRNLDSISPVVHLLAGVVLLDRCLA